MSGIPQATIDAAIIADEHGFQAMRDAIAADEVTELAAAIRRSRRSRGIGPIDCTPARAC